MPSLDWIRTAAVLLLCPVVVVAAVQGEGDGDSGVPDGYVIIEGDIVVPQNFLLLAEGTWNTKLWPDGTVPFVFDTTGNDAVSAQNQSRMIAAFHEWESVANVSFVPRTAEANFINVRDSTNDSNPGNNSHVGMQGGPQTVNIVSWTQHYVLMHELGHALGYWHEHSRPDRVDFVRINYGNVCQDCCTGGSCDHNFVAREEDEAGTYGPYDFDSFMHYRQDEFSANGLPTITVLPPNEHWQTLIGQRDHMSVWDGTIMSFLYPEPDWRFVDPTDAGSAQNGSFLEPFTSVAAGLANVPSGGTLIVMRPMTFASSGELTTPMTLRAPLGGFVIQ